MVDADGHVIDGRGFELTVDEQLTPRKVITGDTEPLSKKYWRDAWKPIIQRGEWVDACESADAWDAESPVTNV